MLNVGQLLEILKHTDSEAHVLLIGATDLPKNVPAGPFTLDRVVETLTADLQGVFLETAHPSDQVGLIQTSAELLHALRQLHESFSLPVFLRGPAGYGHLTQTTEQTVSGVRVLNLLAADAVLHGSGKAIAAAAGDSHEAGQLTDGNATRIGTIDPEAIEGEQLVAGQVFLSPPANGIADELRHGYLLRVPNDQGDCTLVDAHPPAAGELRPARVVNREHVAELLASGVLHKVDPTPGVANGGGADFYV